MALTLAERDAALEAARPRLERLARRLVWDKEDARDVVQSAYVDALARWHQLERGAATEAWLRRIVVNRAISSLRRRKLWKTLGVLFGVEPELVAAPDDELERTEHVRALADAVTMLSARQATAFGLRYFEGLSLDEVADAMSLDRGTVRVHVQRAVKALRAKGLLSSRGES